MAQHERLFYSHKSHVINELVQTSTLNFPTRTSHHNYYCGSGEGRKGGAGPAGARKPPRREEGKGGKEGDV